MSSTEQVVLQLKDFRRCIYCSVQVYGKHKFCCRVCRDSPAGSGQHSNHCYRRQAAAGHRDGHILTCPHCNRLITSVKHTFCCSFCRENPGANIHTPGCDSRLADSSVNRRANGPVVDFQRYGLDTHGIGKDFCVSAHGERFLRPCKLFRAIPNISNESSSFHGIILPTRSLVLELRLCSPTILGTSTSYLHSVAPGSLGLSFGTLLQFIFRLHSYFGGECHSWPHIAQQCPIKWRVPRRPKFTPK